MPRLRQLGTLEPSKLEQKHARLINGSPIVGVRLCPPSSQCLQPRCASKLKCTRTHLLKQQFAVRAPPLSQLFVLPYPWRVLQGTSKPTNGRGNVKIRWNAGGPVLAVPLQDPFSAHLAAHASCQNVGLRTHPC